ncbi:MAG TPA: hypothetical protein VGH98_10410 [Gemmatimonadaceae bacterium]|jgi:hypothetical protein
MKPYREYALMSVSMHDSAELRLLLRDAIICNKIAHVVETGTHEGLGSTRFVAESFPHDAPPKSFVTIEAGWKNWRRAKRNLRPFPGVTPVWGHTLELRTGIEFIERDECIRRHQCYPDVFIDDVEDPVGFYTRELRLGLSGAPRGLWRPLIFAIDRRLRYRGEGLLAKSLLPVRDEKPLIVLDSAGGTGWLEFTTVRETMGTRPYLLLLDDVHHLKHFRSLEHVRRDDAFTILGLDEQHGWMLAQHNVDDRSM